MDSSAQEPGSQVLRFRVSPETLVKSFQDRVALVHMKTKRIQVLNATASSLWKFLSAGNTRAEMEQSLLQEFSVDPEELSSEIDRILMMLEQEGLIEPVNA